VVSLFCVPSSFSLTHTICFESYLFFLSFGDVSQMKKCIFQ
jgi:hypothetical protein